MQRNTATMDLLPFKLNLADLHDNPFQPFMNVSKRIEMDEEKTINEDRQEDPNEWRFFLDAIVEQQCGITRDELPAKPQQLEDGSLPYDFSELGPVQYNILETSFQVGSYMLGRSLGRGAFGSVDVGTDRKSGFSFAVKHIKKSQACSSEMMLESLRREIKATKSVRHENVIRCHDVIHTPKNIHLVMDLGHQDVLAYMERFHGQLTAHTHREIGLGLLKGLEYLHSVGIAHLNIKPENVLISKKNVNPWELTSHHIKVCDLGLCEFVPSDNPMGTIDVEGCCGTPGFMCPEMVMHQPCEGRQADMWSIGVALLEIMGKLPDGWLTVRCGDNFQEDMGEFLDEIRKRDHFDDAETHDLINNLLEWNPNDRLTSYDALDHPWLCNDDSIINSQWKGTQA